MWISIYGSGKGRSIRKAHNAFSFFQLHKIIVSSISKILSGIPIYIFCQVLSKDLGAELYSMECINVSCDCLISRLKGKICSSEKKGLVRVLWTIRYYSNGLFCTFIILFLFLAVIPFISPERTVKLKSDGQRTLFFSPRCSSERIHWGLYWIFRGVFIIFAGMNSEAAMGRAACFYETFWPVSRPLIFQGRKYFYYILPPKNLTCMVTSLRERTAQNARFFKLSDRFERCANSFL
jgi:hypothetical protein